MAACSIRYVFVTAVAAVIRMARLVDVAVGYAQCWYPGATLDYALCATQKTEDAPFLIEAIMRADPAGVWAYRGVRMYLSRGYAKKAHHGQDGFPIVDHVPFIDENDMISSFVFLSTANPCSEGRVRQYASLRRRFVDREPVSAAEVHEIPNVKSVLAI